MSNRTYTPEEIAEVLDEARPGMIAGGTGYSDRVEANKCALVAIIEQQRAEIERLKQCHHCYHGEHRHAADTMRCVNTIERRCQCEDKP